MIYHTPRPPARGTWRAAEGRRGSTPRATTTRSLHDYYYGYYNYVYIYIYIYTHICVYIYIYYGNDYHIVLHYI